MFLIKKLRFYFRLFFALIKKQYKILIVSALLGAVFFIVYPRVKKYIPEPRKTIKIGEVGQYYANDLPENVLDEISFGLVSVSEKGEPVPNIAQSWVATDEGKTYTFKIDEDDFTWQDKKKFKISDVNYNFKDASFAIKDDQIVFSLKEPFSPFPSILSKPLFRKGLIGLGEYKVKKIVKKGSKIESVFLVPHQSTTLPNKLYRFYNNESDLKTAFNLGEIDVINELFDLQGLELSPVIKTNKKVMRDAYIAIFFNTNKTPFGEKAFRQALAYAIPKEGKELRALSPINPASWAYNPDVKPYAYDLTRALSLLDNENQDQSTAKIQITTLPQYEPLANFVKESWKKINIDSEVLISHYIPDDFQVLIIARKIPDDPDQYYFWHSTQEGNISKFTSPRIDKLLEDGRKTLDKGKRESIYFDFQRFLVEESPAIFLSYPTYYEVERK